MPRTKRNILIVTHNHEGGSKLFLKPYIEQNFQGCTVYVLQPSTLPEDPFAPPEGFKLWNFQNPSKILAVEPTKEVLNTVVQDLRITEIFVNHLIHHNLILMGEWITETKLPFTYFIHDYYCVCRNYRLDCGYRYCEISPAHPVCRHYLKDLVFWEWQDFWKQFLSLATKIIAPTNYAASYVRKSYPELRVEVVPHILTSPLYKTFKKDFATREKLRIAFLGNMMECKGEEYLLKLNEFIRRENLPVEFVHIGEYHEEVRAGTQEGIIFTGEYDVYKNSVSEILANFEVGIVAILSNWAETYCYTASEAILSGYPVWALNIGAHALRVAKNNCGWVIPFEGGGIEDRGLANLQGFLRKISSPEGRIDILLKAANTSNFKNGDE